MSIAGDIIEAKLILSFWILCT